MLSSAARPDRGLPEWHWTGPLSVTVDDEHFALGLLAPEDAFMVAKSPAVLRGYHDLLQAERPETIIELGMNTGGSTALLALAARPRRLVGVDLAPEVPPKLAALIAARGMHDTVIPFTGVDQSDRTALARVVEPFGGEPIDLVIDDASHLLDPTVASFEALFPLVAPGGLYIIEDWSADVHCAAQLARHGLTGRELQHRLGAVRSLMGTLNDPGAELPQFVWDALAAAHAAQEGEGGGLPAATNDPSMELLLAIINAAATADLAVLDSLGSAAARPLSDLAIRLSIASVLAPEQVAHVGIDSDQVVVRRGPAAIDPATFTLGSIAADHFGYLHGGHPD